MNVRDRIHSFVTHMIGKMTKQYYFEDYLRVYPDSITFDSHGKKMKASQDDINNYLNHCKFYKFAAQFVKGKQVADIGCGSGYGCDILKSSGAESVSGCDISKESIKFATSRFGKIAGFTLQGITDMSLYANDSFDISISSEVIEHVKEYGMEAKAIEEIRRITRKDGLIIIGTPNSEMFRTHGFSFDEINSLLGKYFGEYVIFENALVPFGEKRYLWESRLKEGRVGIIVSENLNFSETVLPDDIPNPETKKGMKPGIFKFAGYNIDTSPLHNTHSWVILAVNNK